jgi:hypothetical protein
MAPVHAACRPNQDSDEVELHNTAFCEHLSWGVFDALTCVLDLVDEAGEDIRVGAPKLSLDLYRASLNLYSDSTILRQS